MFKDYPKRKLMGLEISGPCESCGQPTLWQRDNLFKDIKNMGKEMKQTDNSKNEVAIQNPTLPSNYIDHSSYKLASSGAFQC